MISGPVLPPRSGGRPRQLVILLHGYGADGEDLIALGEPLGELMLDALFAAPNAPTVCAQNPFGFEWFPIDFERMGESVQTGVPMAREVVVEYLEDVWSRTGLGPGETFLAGFSQGAMLALHTGLSLADPPLGIVSFSGALVHPPGFGAQGHAKPPVCLVHGDMDGVVNPAFTQQAAEALSAAGHDVSLHISRGMAHGIAPDGLGFAARFMTARIGAATP